MLRRVYRKLALTRRVFVVIPARGRIADVVAEFASSARFGGSGERNSGFKPVLVISLAASIRNGRNERTFRSIEAGGCLLAPRFQIAPPERALLRLLFRIVHDSFYGSLFETDGSPDELSGKAIFTQQGRSLAASR